MHEKINIRGLQFISSRLTSGTIYDRVAENPYDLEDIVQKIKTALENVLPKNGDFYLVNSGVRYHTEKPHFFEKRGPSFEVSVTYEGTKLEKLSEDLMKEISKVFTGVEIEDDITRSQGFYYRGSDRKTRWEYTALIFDPEWRHQEERHQKEYPDYANTVLTDLFPSPIYDPKKKTFPEYNVDVYITGDNVDFHNDKFYLSIYRPDENYIKDTGAFLEILDFVRKSRRDSVLPDDFMERVTEFLGQHYDNEDSRYVFKHKNGRSRVHVLPKAGRILISNFKLSVTLICVDSVIALEDFLFLLERAFHLNF